MLSIEARRTAARLLQNALACGLLLVAAGPLAAQTGGLEVVVLAAEDRQPLAGATVGLESAQGLVPPTSAVADERGIVLFPVLRAGGGYVVEVSMPGFATYRAGDLRVRSGERHRFVIQLSAALEERIEVTAERAVVDLERSGSSSRFQSGFIENLPVPGRFYQNILSLAPGVQDQDGDGNPNVHGSRTRTFRAEVGGISNVDPLTGEWLSYVSTDSIEELELLPAGAGVEFGRASGGFARILQKQGSNDFEGLVSFIYRSSDLDGAGPSTLIGQEPPEFAWSQPAAQISGPIVKDRLWYRLTHEHIDREDPVVLIDRTAVVTRTQSMNSDQITWQASPRNKLAFQFQSDPLTIENYELESRVAPESAKKLKRGGATYSLNWTVPVSARLLIDTTLAWQDHEREILPMTTGAFQECLFFPEFSSGFTSLNRSRCLNTDSGVTSGSFPETNQDRRQRLTLRSQATVHVNRFLGASHRLKLGLTIENERFFRRLVRRPDISFFTVTDPFSGNVTGFATVQVAAPDETRGRATGAAWSLYAEDQVRLRSNLTLTAGLRLDREEIRSEGQEVIDPVSEVRRFNEALASRLSLQNAISSTFTALPSVSAFIEELAAVLDVLPTEVPPGPGASQSTFWPKKRRLDDISLNNTHLSPRLSLSWDPGGNGKTKLSVTAGRYHDKIVLAVPLLELEPPETTLAFLAFPIFNFFWAVPHTFGGFDPSVRVHMVDRGLETPYQDELSVSFERELARETSIKLTYLRRRFRDQLQDTDINHQTADHGFCRSEPFLGPLVVEPSPGVGNTLTDPYTGEEYVDDRPGPGDGRIDDCTGDVLNEGGTFGRNFEVPDGLPDLYIQNPGWGELLFVGNINRTDYEAFVLELVRRLYRGWELNASYTGSEARGSAEDFSQELGNERNLLEDEFGFLSYDQRHVVKVNVATRIRSGFRLGGSVRWESGLPFSLLDSKLTVFGRSPQYENLSDIDQRFRLRYPTRQRNDQRSPDTWTVDVRLAREIALASHTQLQVTVEIFNLLDDQTVQVDRRVNGITSSERRFGRRFQLGMRLSF